MHIRYVTWLGMLLFYSAATSEAQVLLSGAEGAHFAGSGVIDASVWQAEGQKSGTTATLLGLVLPGGGHFYAGEPGRGALLLGGTALAFSYAFSDPKCKRPFNDVRTCELEEKNQVGLAASWIATVTIYGFSVWDAHRAAHRTNVRRGFEVGAVEISPHLGVEGFRRVSAGLSLRLSPWGR